MGSVCTENKMLDKVYISQMTGEEKNFCVIYEGEYLRSIIPEETLERELSGERVMAVEKFLRLSSVVPSQEVFSRNPGYSYCLQVGGQVLNYLDEYGEMGVCQFADGSEIDQWTLFRGFEIHKKFTSILQ